MRLRKTAVFVVLTVSQMVRVAHAQLSIDFVSNAASYAFAPLPNSSIAQGAFFVILGNGGQAGIATAAWGTYPLPTTLGSTSVAITVQGAVTNAFIYYVGPSWGIYSTQIDAVMPSDTPTGRGTLVVTQNGVPGAAFPVTVVGSSFGAYSLNGAGTGPGVFYNVTSGGSMARNDLFHAAKPGQIVALFGTGLGPAANPSQEGTQSPSQVDLRSTSFLLDVWVADQQATVEYTGRSSYTAEDEIVFTVPGGVSGCYNPVAISAGPPGNQTVSNFTSLAVDASGAACRDADGINTNDLVTAIKNRGAVNVGAISLASNYQDLNTPGLGTLQWDNDTVTGEIATFTTEQLDASLGFTNLPSVNSCTVIPYLQYPPPLDPVLGGALGPVVFLDAGVSLSITGPNGTAAVPKSDSGNGYSALVGGATIDNLITGCPPTSTNNCAPFFLNATAWGTSSWTYTIDPGAYTVSAPGGSNVGAFLGDISVSSAAASFKWTNQSAIGTSIPRNTPLTIKWTGGDPNGFVQMVALASTLQAGITPSSTTPGAMVECIAAASAGSFTIPVHVLQSLPSTASSTALLPPGSLQVGPVSGAVGITPAPSGLDVAYLFYHYSAGSTVIWQ